MQINANEMGLREFYSAFLQIVFSDMGPFCKKVILGYLALVVFFLIFGRKKERIFFGIVPALFLVALVNPLSVYVLSRYLDLSSRYFRFLWLLPVTVTYGYFLAWLIARIKSRKAAAVIAYALSAVILLYSAKNVMAVTSRLYNGVGSNPGMLRIDNVYKIQSDTLQIAEIIERDKGDPERAVKALYGYDVFMDIRTYDASIFSGLTLHRHNKYRSETLRLKKLNKLYDSGSYARLLCYLVDAREPSKEIDFDPEKIGTALKEEDFRYVIIQTDKYAMSWFEACGDIIGVTDHFTVIRVSDS